MDQKRIKMAQALILGPWGEAMASARCLTNMQNGHCIHSFYFDHFAYFNDIWNDLLKFLMHYDALTLVSLRCWALFVVRPGSTWLFTGGFGSLCSRVPS